MFLSKTSENTWVHLRIKKGINRSLNKRDNLRRKDAKRVWIHNWKAAGMNRDNWQPLFWQARTNQSWWWWTYGLFSLANIKKVIRFLPQSLLQFFSFITNPLIYLICIFLFSIMQSLWTNIHFVFLCLIYDIVTIGC